jgi:para-aminobenzoate synthetase component I
VSTVALPLPAAWDAPTVFALLDAVAEHVFWLDAGPDAAAGWSFVGVGAEETDPDRVRAVAAGAGSVGAGPPFRGGWVGWIGYENGAAVAGAPARTSEDPVPNERWLRVDAVVAFDHAAGTAEVVGSSDAATAVVRALSASAPSAVAPSAVAAPAASVARARHRPLEYAALVEGCRARIRDGDAYQLCLTTRFSVDAAVDPAAVHTRLRTQSPSHHGGIVRSGAVALVSASPERFLSIGDGVVRTHPIKGTRRRGGGLLDDRELVEELISDPKERAENVMIVDLMRNDLSRIGRPGTVAVERLLEVETYPAVHQLVSTVAAALAPGATIGDVLDATFPAGSMTGAPKLSAMTILHELEGAERGVFAGCFGWIGDDGGADLAMVIRSVITHPGGAYVGAGGGITWLSRPAAEVAEVALKARAPLAALGAVLPPDWER